MLFIEICKECHHFGKKKVRFMKPDSYTNHCKLLDYTGADGFYRKNKLDTKCPMAQEHLDKKAELKAVLSKDVCKKCLNDAVEKDDWEGDPWQDYLWESQNDKCWNEHYQTSCPKHNYQMTSICKIPEKCEYKFEHEIMAQEL